MSIYLLKSKVSFIVSSYIVLLRAREEKNDAPFGIR